MRNNSLSRIIKIASAFPTGDPGTDAMAAAAEAAKGPAGMPLLKMPKPGEKGGDESKDVMRIAHELDAKTKEINGLRQQLQESKMDAMRTQLKADIASEQTRMREDLRKEQTTMRQSLWQEQQKMRENLRNEQIKVQDQIRKEQRELDKQQAQLQIAKAQQEGEITAAQAQDEAQRTAAQAQYQAEFTQAQAQQQAQLAIEQAQHKAQLDSDTAAHNVEIAQNKADSLLDIAQKTTDLYTKQTEKARADADAYFNQQQQQYAQAHPVISPALQGRLDGAMKSVGRLSRAYNDFTKQSALKKNGTFGIEKGGKYRGRPGDLGWGTARRQKPGDPVLGTDMQDTPQVPTLPSQAPAPRVNRNPQPVLGRSGQQVPGVSTRQPVQEAPSSTISAEEELHPRDNPAIGMPRGIPDYMRPPSLEVKVDRQYIPTQIEGLNNMGQVPRHPFDPLEGEIYKSKLISMGEQGDRPLSEAEEWRMRYATGNRDVRNRTPRSVKVLSEQDRQKIEEERLEWLDMWDKAGNPVVQNVVRSEVNQILDPKESIHELAYDGRGDPLKYANVNISLPRRVEQLGFLYAKLHNYRTLLSAKDTDEVMANWIKPVIWSLENRIIPVQQAGGRYREKQLHRILSDSRYPDEERRAAMKELQVYNSMRIGTRLKPGVTVDTRGAINYLWSNPDEDKYELFYQDPWDPRMKWGEDIGYDDGSTPSMLTRYAAGPRMIKYEGKKSMWDRVGDFVDMPKYILQNNSRKLIQRELEAIYGRKLPDFDFASPFRSGSGLIGEGGMVSSIPALPREFPGDTIGGKLSASSEANLLRMSDDLTNSYTNIGQVLDAVNEATMPIQLFAGGAGAVRTAKGLYTLARNPKLIGDTLKSLLYKGKWATDTGRFIPGIAHSTGRRIWNTTKAAGGLVNYGIGNLMNYHFLKEGLERIALGDPHSIPNLRYLRGITGEQRNAYGRPAPWLPASMGLAAEDVYGEGAPIDQRKILNRIEDYKNLPNMVDDTSYDSIPAELRNKWPFYLYSQRAIDLPQLQQLLSDPAVMQKLRMDFGIGTE